MATASTISADSSEQISIDVYTASASASACTSLCTRSASACTSSTTTCTNAGDTTCIHRGDDTDTDTTSIRINENGCPKTNTTNTNIITTNKNNHRDNGNDGDNSFGNGHGNDYTNDFGNGNGNDHSSSANDTIINTNTNTNGEQSQYKFPLIPCTQNSNGPLPQPHSQPHSHRPNRTIYMDGVFDLFHIGHLRAIQHCSTLGNRVIIGITGDADATSYKRPPIIAQNERIAIISALRVVDAVVCPCPLVVTEEFMDDHGIDLVVHGFANDDDAERQEVFFEQVVKVDKFRRIPYYGGQSTTDILKKIRSLPEEEEEGEEVEMN